MINVKTPDSPLMFCNVCLSEVNVMQIEVMRRTRGQMISGTTGLMFCLCERCREELVDKLCMVDKGRTAKE